MQTHMNNQLPLSSHNLLSRRFQEQVSLLEVVEEHGNNNLQQWTFQHHQFLISANKHLMYQLLQEIFRNNQHY